MNTASLLIAVILIIITGSYRYLGTITARSWMLMILSGILQTFSWLTFFAGLRDAQVNVYMALDKTNIIVTMLLAFFFASEPITLPMLAGTGLILVGTVIMTEVQGGWKGVFRRENVWIIWGIVSPALQAMTNICAKLDTNSVSTDLATGIRTCIVVVVLWLLVLLRTGKPGKELLRQPGSGALVVAGLLIGLSYIFMYRAIAVGQTSVVTTIVKSSALMVAVLAHFFLHEHLSLRGIAGLFMTLFGTILFAF